MNSFIVNPSDRKKIEFLLSLNEDQLYVRLQQHNPEHRGKLYSPEKQVETGKKDFKELEKDIHQSICQNWSLCEKIDNPEWEDPVNLVAGMADSLTANIGGWIPVFTISALLVKIGIRKLCNCGS